MKPTSDFSLTGLVVLVLVLMTGLIMIYYFNRKEQRRLQRENELRYPSATRTYSKTVNDKLRHKD